MSSRARKKAKQAGVVGKVGTIVPARPAPKVWAEGPPAGEPHWRIVPNQPGRQYYPDGPDGPYCTLRGWCRPEGTGRYEQTEQDICGREIEIEVLLVVSERTNGIRVWCATGIPVHSADPSDPLRVWYQQTSHFKNTLLNDPEFDALITPMLRYDLPDRDERGALLANKEET